MSTTSPINIENACKNGDIQVIVNAKGNIKWNRKNSNNQTYLDIAIIHQQFDVIETLIGKGCVEFLQTNNFDKKILTILSTIELKNPEISEEFRHKISNTQYELMKNPNITLADIKDHLNKYTYIQNTLYKGLNIVDELLNFYCAGTDRRYETKTTDWRGNEQLLKYEFSHDLQIITYLIEHCNANVNSCGSIFCRTPLIAAVDAWTTRYNCYGSRDKNMSKKIVDLLLAYRANINECSADTYKSPLQMVICYSNKCDLIANANYLISMGAIPNSAPIDIRYIMYNDVALKWYVDNLLYKPEQGTQILKDICYYNSSDVYFYLVNNVEFSEDIKSNNFNSTNQSLLHVACSAGEYNDNALAAKSIPIINDLITKRGIKIDIQNSKGHTCLYSAIAHQNFYTAMYLIHQHNIIISERDLEAAICPISNGWCKFKLFNAIFNKFIAHYNFEQYVNPYCSYTLIKNYCMMGPTKIFSYWNEHDTQCSDILILEKLIKNLSIKYYSEVFDLLCKNGVAYIAEKLCVIPKNKEELLNEICTSPYLSTHYQHGKYNESRPFTKTMKMLLSMNIDLTHRINGSSPLHVLCNNKKALGEQIELLIEYGADIDAIDSNGKTPVSLARSAHKCKYDDKKNDNYIVKILKREGATK